MLNKILIANRGEIACRIIKTAKRLGIKTVAVYSDFDENSLHSSLADESYHIGGSAAKDSYLDGHKIIEVAKKSGAQGVHPGYGFLSENAQFAQSCQEANIKFIGPPISAIEAMGSKSAAKEIMEKAGVPLVKGYHGKNQQADYLKQQAIDIGFPVLLKATAGGGGKGMKIVNDESEFLEQLSSCQREAKSSFGNNEILIEKYLTQPRHVEIQIFADEHDHQIHLFERDCSVQRRHQKVIEEAPAPNIPDDIRKKLGEVAIQSAKAIGYVGAGTVEFLYDSDNSFYFMEMNTRLQVEHPVTEMITGIDLVEWQLLIASGEKLPCTQNEIKVNGHAFEARIYAEDPDNNFLPATGKIKYLQMPTTNSHIRIDSGVIEGDEIGIYYDPMIAKLIVWEKTRKAALSTLHRSLNDFQISGLVTNINFLKAISTNKTFMDANLDTGFIEKEHQNLFRTPASITTQTIVLCALYLMLNRHSTAQHAIIDQDVFSPWNMTNGWRLNKRNHHTIDFIEYIQPSAIKHQLIVHFCEQGFDIEYLGNNYHVQGELKSAHTLAYKIEGYQSQVNIVNIDNQLNVFTDKNTFTLSIPSENLESDTDIDDKLTSPMPGTIIKVNTKIGAKVAKGDPLMIMEAMKMEHTITSPIDGIVEEIFFSAGEQVQEAVELLKIKKVSPK